MDIYQQNPTTLRRLLNKRQNPCTQIFKTQPLNPTNGPNSTINLARNNVTAAQDNRNFNFTTQDSTLTNNLPNNMTTQFNSQTTENFSQNTTGNSTIPTEDDDEDGDCQDFEIVQKKIKTSMVSTQDKTNSRRPSCEEYKEENDHSTSCETHSEVYHINETGDFLLSPQHSFQSSKETTELKLDDDEVLQNDILNHLSQVHSQEEADVSRLAHSKAKSNCKINHQCEPDISTGACPRCESLLGECKEFAKKNGGLCLNRQYDESVVYECQKGHRWSLNHRNARRRWCAQCAKEERAFLKKKCEQEKVEREKQEEECQQKLFEEAKKKAMKENAPQSNQFQGGNSSHQRPMSALEYFQRIDFEIETLAKKYTVEFMSQKDFTGNVTYQQSLQVYKIIIMPDEILQSYMYFISLNQNSYPTRFNLNSDTLRSEFRRMAKIIHPDKNKHPQAANAFKKVYGVYEAALSRLEGTQKKI